MDFLQQAFRTSLFPKTKYRFSHHILSPLGSMDKHTRVFHKKLSLVYYLGKLTIQSHIILWHSKWYILYIMDDYILWFDITMDDTKWMYFVNCLTYLLYYWCYFILCHRLWSFQLMEELPACSYFENNIDVIFIIKVPIHLDDIWMIKIELNL